jgi:small subunit ribosomal protein S20
MPLLPSAIKKLRQDKVRTQRNKRYQTLMRKALRKAKELKTAKAVSEAFRAVDRAVKKGIIKDNKAGRLKSSLSKLAKPMGKVTKKTPAKK